MVTALIERELLLANLVARYGAGKVWNAGLEFIGHPPTWMIGAKSLITLTEKLEALNG